MFLWSFKRKKAIKRMRYVHKIGKKELIEVLPGV